MSAPRRKLDPAKNAVRQKVVIKVILDKKKKWEIMTNTREHISSNLVNDIANMLQSEHSDHKHIVLLDQFILAIYLSSRKSEW